MTGKKSGVGWQESKGRHLVFVGLAPTLRDASRASIGDKWGRRLPEIDFNHSIARDVLVVAMGA